MSVRAALEDDTIVAVSSPPGGAFRAIVRLSGPQAFQVLESRLERSGPLSSPARRVKIDELRLRRGLTLPGTVVRLRGPATYTREDVAEFHCAGSPPLVREVLATLVEAGARIAEPGEFTRRAFRNGRIDLVQAEAVLGLVAARTDDERRCASESLAGAFGRDVQGAKEAIADLLALVEAALDFSDQDIEIVSEGDVATRLDALVERVERMGRSHSHRPTADDAPRVVLCGAPNAGKSSLLNALVGTERSIVTEIAGTTLDVVEADLVLGADRIVLVDTPGFLDAVNGELDAEAERRARDVFESAALCVLVVDSSRGRGEVERYFEWGRAALESACDVRILEVESKLDVAPYDAGCSAARCRVSSVTRNGLDALRASIAELALDSASRPALAAAARHGALLEVAAEALARGRDAVASARPLEIVAVDLREALDALGEIVGAVTTDDLLGRIFSQFCIGK
ncbi:MAG: tRNA modification GTPase [Planctomycetes bacterium]|nr:tRNA modification GTPase [Planctomycetota bacterium]